MASTTARTLAFAAASLALAPMALPSAAFAGGGGAYAAMAHGHGHDGSNGNPGSGYGPGSGFHHIDGGRGGTIVGPTIGKLNPVNPIFTRPQPLTGARPTSMP